MISLSRFVIPAQAGIQVRFQFVYKRLDSGLRRNDERKSRLLGDEFIKPWLKAEIHSV